MSIKLSHKIGYCRILSNEHCKIRDKVIKLRHYGVSGTRFLNYVVPKTNNEKIDRI